MQSLNPKYQVFLSTILVLAGFLVIGCNDEAQSKKKQASKSLNAIGVQNNTTINPCFRLLGDHDHEHEGEHHDEKGHGDHQDHDDHMETNPNNDNVNGDCTGSPDTNPAPGNSLSSGINLSVMIESCRAQRKLSITFGGPGKAATCSSQPLARFCCSVQNVASVFGQLPASVNSGLQILSGQGYKLYNCSSSPSNSELHLVQVSGNRVSHRSFWFSGVQAI